MKIAFHANQLCLRGTSVAMFDYAHFNQTLLNNESFIIYDKNCNWNRPGGLKRFSSNFKVISYDDFKQVDTILEKEKADCCYMIKPGNRDGKEPRACKYVVHVVFQYFEPYGDVYAYVAEWLSNKMTNGKYPFVPHMFRLPAPNGGLRKKLNIPQNAIVFGRHGGYDEFNIPFVHKTISDIAKEKRNLYFLFVNTKPFCGPMPNIIHLGPICDLQEKSNFINTCDAMLHARQMGESFSVAIGEFLFFDKPVISWTGGDPGHIFMLKDKGLFYSDADELRAIISNYKKDELNNKGIYKALVAEYTPKKVMDKFKQVFLS